MPLTAASELENHPALSAPYKSKVLQNMTRQAGETLQKERRCLANLKVLMTDLRGDHRWIPGGRFYSPDDSMLYAADSIPNFNTDPPRGAVGAARQAGREQEPDAVGTIGSVNKSAVRRSAEPDKASEPSRLDDVLPATAREAGQPDHVERDLTVESNATKETRLLRGSTEPEIRAGEPSMQSKSAGDQGAAASSPPANPSANDAGGHEASSPPPRMITRGRAQAQASHAHPDSPAQLAGDADPDPAPVHALFVSPESARPGRGCGLPAAEADETRRTLAALVQKQEEVVHGTAQLYEGLLRADRLARTVWGWCRAEAHAGEMSDGEDWVDGEAWDLEGPLKKGQEEPEDTVEKKTRGRRGAQ